MDYEALDFDKQHNRREGFQEMKRSLPTQKWSFLLPQLRCVCLSTCRLNWFRYFPRTWFPINSSWVSTSVNYLLNFLCLMSFMDKDRRLSRLNFQWRRLVVSETCFFGGYWSQRCSYLETRLNTLSFLWRKCIFVISGKTITWVAFSRCSFVRNQFNFSKIPCDLIKTNDLFTI